MAFINDIDYITVAGEASLKVLQQGDNETREIAEQAAIDEIKGYLASRYDVEAVFSATDDSRSKIIVTRTVDIALYNLVSALPGRMGFEIREIRYKRAIEWLQEVQKGNIAAGLPTVSGPGGEEDFHNPVKYNPGQKNNYDW